MVKRPLIPHPTDPALMLVPLANGRGFATISARWSGEVGQHNWAAVPQPHTTYAMAHHMREDGGKTKRSLHRLIGELRGFDPALEVDHENHDGLNCRDDNLREASGSQNQHNQKIAANNTSGVKGVSRHKKSGKWQAQIKVKRRAIALGLYVEKSDAEAAVRAARERLHGEFATDGLTPRFTV